MAAKRPLTVSTGPVINALSAKERRAAQVAEIADRQSVLKREAAERRAAREARAAAQSD
jgi:hypothetical protein